MGTAKERVRHFVIDDVERLAAYLERVNFAACADQLQRRLRLAWVNGRCGLFRGVGSCPGFTLVAGLLILLLQWLEVLNFPIIGKHIAGLV